MGTASTRLLLVEDDEEDFIRTRKLLRENGRTEFDLNWVKSCGAALEELRAPYDVCLVDYRLGADSGLSLIQQAITQGFRGPMILLTGRGDHDVDVQAMQAGAADYLVKDQLTPQLMERVIRHSIARKAAELALVHSEDQLRQAQKMDAIGSLAGGVAHDFNNLLSIVLSYSELLSVGLDPGHPMLDDLQQISEAGVRAAGLTRQLLAFSHQQVLQPRVIDPNEIFAKLEKMLRRVIGEDVELRSLAAPSLRCILADPGQLEQVLMNLTVNARDAMPQGGKLTVETKNVTLDEAFAALNPGIRPGAHVLLTVSDTGVGMDRATMNRIFEPFFTTKEIGKGTGLGLATVFGIVRQSGGVICVDSQLGTGTTFRVYLPCAAGQLPVHSESSAPERRSLSGTETVLVVEDEDRIRSLVRTILVRYGYVVLDAQSGADALILCEEFPGNIDLLLTDVVMPRMSGRQLAERLHSLRPEMKTLYMSGYMNDAVVRHGVLEKTIAFIQKPITPEALARKIREVLETEHGTLIDDSGAAHVTP
jgi:two-component system cell cycle sensor histidine kinase/response regulator CckA